MEVLQLKRIKNFLTVLDLSQLIQCVRKVAGQVLVSTWFLRLQLDLLCRGVVHRIHDARGHRLDKRHRVAHNLAPLVLGPDIVSGLLTIEETIVAPDVLNVVELAHLGESPHKSLGVLVVAHSNAPGPVVAPLHHGARLQLVARKTKNNDLTEQGPKA